MKRKILSSLKNKYVISTVLFSLYALFLDDYDIFTIINQKQRLTAIEAKNKEVDYNLKKTKETLADLQSMDNVVHYARSVKFFKKDDEEIFVVTHE
jgi:cell division protein DivIC